ncbi:hypothetical protein [Oligoflexus tunisiensis]|uniref:hypothetical protein n=1 Tax=Oligoflexus tunisiensis TaxID=708132 RepID=UPI00114D1A98|nr:hypothetical protein [Oligoflexus tunisiensis]
MDAADEVAELLVEKIDGQIVTVTGEINELEIGFEHGDVRVEGKTKVKYDEVTLGLWLTFGN